jgi:hypothetical protein
MALRHPVAVLDPGPQKMIRKESICQAKSKVEPKSTKSRSVSWFNGNWNPDFRAFSQSGSSHGASAYYSPMTALAAACVSEPNTGVVLSAGLVGILVLQRRRRRFASMNDNRTSA